MNNIKLIVVGILIGICSAPAHSLDITSIVSRQCEMYSGIVIFVSTDSVKLIGFDGRVKSVSTDDIDSIFTYGYKLNPFTQFDLRNGSYRYLKEIYFDADAKTPDVIGWPIKFVEDLIFFYSLQGKMHVLSIEQIQKMRPYKSARDVRHLEYSPVRLEVSDYLAQCDFEQTPDESETLLRPVRIISDQIKIGQYLDNFTKGMHDLENFEDRTYLYARPFMFPWRNRLSIPYVRENYGIESNIPFAFIWSSGRDYHFQSAGGIGAQRSDNLPYLGPQFLLRTDAKSHFFNATFEVNMMGISAGTNPFGTFKSDGSDIAQVSSRAIESLNYLAVLGADYGPFSVGYGTYFPVHEISFSEFDNRVVLADRVSPFVRFNYIKPKYKIRISGAQTKYDINPNKIDEQLVLSSFHSAIEDSGEEGGISLSDVSDYRFINRFIRAGGEADVYRNVKLSADIVYSRGEYHETFLGTNNRLAFNNTTLYLSIEHAFSYYINLKIFYHIVRRDNVGSYQGDSINRVQTVKGWGGYFELLF